MLPKKFMAQHTGFNRNELQDWLNLFSFIMNTPINRYEKAIELIKLVLNTQEKLRPKNESKKMKKRPEFIVIFH